MEGGKRKLDSIEKPVCQYGTSCYRKNPTHFQEYTHLKDSCNSKKQKFEKKHVNDHPTTSSSKNITFKNPCEEKHGFYFTTVSGIDDCYNDSSIALSIKDILSEKASALVESAQFNYMFDVPWLISCYPSQARSKPLLLVHGFTGIDKQNLQSEAMNFTNLNLCQAPLPILYGTHHSKMMFLLYTNELRIIIHTSNLIEKDWHQKTQGLWKSPLFQKINKEYDVKTDQFKTDLKEYLLSYKNERLKRWINIINDYDMTTANVQLVASTPGRHVGIVMNQWGHLKLRKLLKQSGPSNKSSVASNWSIIGQFSSIGSLGDEASKWLTSEWLKSLSTCSSPLSNVDRKFKLNLIYPTMENVRNSLEGYSAGGSLPFSVKTAMKQRYMRQYLCQWISNKSGRSLASPHIKSYTCLSSDNKEIAWFLLTSANLSKAAWGVYEKNKSQFMIRSYEIGVLFTPKYSNCKVFKVDNTSSVKEDTSKYFQLPYDVPLTPYKDTDKPWVWDIRYTKEDSHGRLWVPT